MSALSNSPVSETPSSWARGLGIYSKFVCIYVFLVIFAGALVTSHDAGLSVPDWPTSYGENMFLFPVYRWIGGIYFEHGHRLLATGMGALTVILALWTALVENRRWVRFLTYAAFGTVIVQGLLGGMTVLLRLPDLISTGHGVLAQTFMVILVIIAYSHSGSRNHVCENTISDPTILRAASITALLVYIQLILGAIMRHTGSGLAILDFPLMAGSLIPLLDDTMVATINASRKSLQMAPVSLGQIALHLLHRCGAIVVTLAVISLFIRVVKERALPFRVRRAATLLFLLVLTQFGLGIASVLSLRSPVIASVHVVVGAFVLSVSIVLVLRVREVMKESANLVKHKATKQARTLSQVGAPA